jgi:chemotaxis protein methyltransferase CheR
MSPAADAADTADVADIEMELLLEAVFRRWGYDFRSYSRVHLRRRLADLLCASGLDSLSAFQGAILRDEGRLRALIAALSIQVTDMFRDPAAYRFMRGMILPVLATWPSLRIWHAGCASGEEVYSMAILLEEGGLLDHSRIFATDMSMEAVARAREGVYPAARMRDFTENYRHAGGSASFSDYYSANYNSAILDPRLRRAVTFSQHNLAGDGVFGEMNMVVCRNVLIYFARPLQDRALTLFADSLGHGGILWLGSKESLAFSSVANKFETVNEEYRIFRKRHDG